MDKRTTDVIYLDLCETFDMILHHILISKLEIDGFEGWTIRWVRNWLDGCRGLWSIDLCSGRDWSQVMSPKGPSWGQCSTTSLLITWIVGSSISSKFAGDTMLRVAADKAEGREAIQKDLKRL